LLGLREKANKMIVATQSYETTVATIDSQILSLRASGANLMFNVAIPKFAAQAIRKIYDIGWKPIHILNNVSSSVGLVMRPAGPTFSPFTVTRQRRGWSPCSSSAATTSPART
jgi:branched-chain amino acid transport system substrate-binding protein